MRLPGSSRYVLDLSGSMEGQRIAGLKEAMLLLSADGSVASDHYARFQNREEMGIITFSTRPADTVLFEMKFQVESPSLSALYKLAVNNW